MDPAQATPAVKSTPGRRRWPRRAVRLVVLLGILLAGVAALLTQSAVLKWLILPQISSALGGEATASRIAVTLGGEVVISDLRVAASGVGPADSPAAEVLRAQRVGVTLDWGSLVSLSPRLRELRLDKPRLRISQAPDFSINLAGLGSGAAGGTRRPSHLPALTIAEGELELGEHGLPPAIAPGGYRALASLRIQGGIVPDPSSAGRYTVDLREVGPDRARPLPADKGVALVGRIDLAADTAEVKLSSLDLSRWSTITAPSPVRGLWDAMRLRGKVNAAVFSIDPKDGFAVTFNLDGVDLNIPIPVETRPANAKLFAPDLIGPPEPPRATLDAILLRPGTEAQLLAMRRVTGDVAFRARGLDLSLSGNIEDLPVRLTLRSGAFGPDMPLNATISISEFVIADRPELLPFAPEEVRRLFRRFGGPTATVSGSVQISRAAPAVPGRAAPLAVQGQLAMKNGRGAFERFQYPIENIEGLIEFTSDTVKITRLSGRGPTGAKLLASGLISPLDEASGVDVTVTVLDVPMDEHFRGALETRRPGLFDAIFNAAAYQRLADRGLLQPAGEKARRSARLAEIDRRLDAPGPADDAAALGAERATLQTQLAAPVFDLGGVANIDVHVRCDVGVGTPYFTTIKFNAARAGLLPKAFPYPVIAEGVAAVIRDDDADVSPATLRGLAGGVATFGGRLDLPGTDVLPDFTVEARGLPADELLISALPGGDDASAKFSTKRVLRGLNLRGAVDVSARIRPKPGVETGFDADVTFEGVSARAAEGPAGLTGLRGRVAASERSITVTGLSGTLTPADGSAAFEPSPVTASLAAEFAPGPDLKVTRLDGRVALPELDLRVPVEAFVGLVAPDAAADLRRLRETHTPRGVLSADVRIAGAGPGDPDFTIALSDLRNLGFSVWGAPVELFPESGERRGRVEISPAAIALADVRTTVSSGGLPAGTLSADGRYARRPGSPAELRVALEEGRFEAPALRAIVRGLAGERVGSTIDDANPRGAFSGAIVHSTDAGGAPSTAGEIRPVSITVRRRGTDVAFDAVRGVFRFTPESGRFDGLRAGTAEWSVDLDGDVPLGRAASGEGPRQLRLSAQSTGLPASLRAILPREVDEALTALKVRCDGPLTIDGGVLAFAPGAADPSFRGTIGFSGVAMNAALPVTDAAGTLAVDFQPAQADTPQRFRLELLADRFRYSGLRMTGGHAKIESPGPGVYLLPVLRADVHGGVLSARGAITPAAPAPTPGRTAPSAAAPKRFELHAELDRVDFPAALADLITTARASGGSPGAPAEPMPEALPPLDDRSPRGQLDAQLSVTGLLDDALSRAGRGIVRVQGGEVIRLPGVLPILRLSNLQAPVNEPLNFAYADFHITGPVFRLDDLSVESQSIAIRGSGIMTTPDLALDVAVNSRSLNRVPILSDILEGVRDEVVSTRVRGTLASPQVTYESLKGTRQLLDTVFGGRREPPPVRPQDR
ncbi:MAG: hypothetical protein IBJ11_09320 [Phycisphaerales bacterium]|nr:hypothetical protein [Phycisphaerales bacterium]